MDAITEEEAAVALARSAHVREGRARAAERKVQAEAAEWAEPQSLVPEIEPEMYPLEALPPCVRAAVEEVQGFVQAPLALVASCALGALAVAVQAHVDVRRAAKLAGPSSLFFLTVAESGERKSTVDSFFMKAIRDYESQQREVFAPVVADYRADMAAWESKYSGLRDKIRDATKKGNSTATLEDQLRDLERHRPQQPRVPRFLFENITPEELAYALAHNWPSGAVMSAEAGIVFGSHGMGADSVMRNLTQLNKLWEGGVLPIDRRTSDSFTVDGARLSMGLQVQEAVLRAFFDKNGTLARGSGFLARFLIARPASTQGYRPYVEPPDAWPHLGAFNQKVAELLERNAPLDERGGL